MPSAFITGITGQDGQHLAEFLHDQGYDVFGMVKGQNNPRDRGAAEEMPFVEMVPGDLADLPSLVSALEVCATRRGLQPRRDQLRGVELQSGRADRQHHRSRRVAHARGDPHGRRHAEQPDPLLPGVVLGDVRQGPRDAADRDDAVPPARPVRLRQGVRSRHRRSTTARATACTPARGSCSTTRARAAASSS